MSYLTLTCRRRLFWIITFHWICTYCMDCEGKTLEVFASILIGENALFLNPWLKSGRCEQMYFRLYKGLLPYFLRFITSRKTLVQRLDQARAEEGFRWEM
jgi:hypothetical protein